MNIATVFRVLGILLMLFSLTHLVPLAVSILYNDGEHLIFLLSFIITLIIGLVIWVPSQQNSNELKTRDGFLLTSLFWIVLGLFGSMPFMMNSYQPLSISDAVFESISGLSTTGATVISGLDTMPKSLLYYRQQLQWLGGIGIIVIAIAILPLLGIGGMQLYRAEAGPIKDNKLTPRIAETAYWLFFIYAMLTIVCAFCYWLAGMSGFDAISHSFATISIGGFSTHDASLGYFDSPLIWMIASVFMFIAALNFTLHFYTYKRLSFRHYLSDSESRFYFFFILGAAVAVVACLFVFRVDRYLDNAAWHAIVQTVSIATTTGFTTTNFSAWPSFIPISLFFLSCVGGCAGSTGGGLKAIRVVLIAKQGWRELQQLVHPNAVIPLKLNRRTVPVHVLSAVWSFLAIYGLAFLVILILLQACGLDFFSAYAATISSLNNVGPSLGVATENYASLSAAAKWVLCLSMLLGRLEIFTLLVIFTPAFWRD